MNAFMQSVWARFGRRRGLLWLAAALALYTLAGFFLLPPILRSQMVKRLPEIVKRQASVRQVKVNPWALSLTVRGLALTEADGRPFASWEELYVNFQASSLFRWAWTFDEIRLEKPVGEIILLRDGRLNFANILEAPTNAPPKPAQSAAIPRIRISHLSVSNGFVAFEDRTRRSLFRTEYRPINLVLRDFTTQPHSDTPYSFHAESDAGRSIAWAGDLTAQPLKSSGHLEVTAVQLPRYQPYLEEFTRARLTNGLADLRLAYRLSADTNGLDIVVTNATLRVADVRATDPETGETVASLSGLEARGARFNLRERAASIGSVKATEAALLARLKKNGHFNLLDLLALPPAATNAATAAPRPPAAASPFTLDVEDFAVERAAVQFEDMTRSPVFRTELNPIEVKVTGFSTRPGRDGTYSVRVASEAAETIEAGGSFCLDPLRSSGELKTGAVELKKYLPYAADFFRGQIVSGKLGARIPYRAAFASGGLEASVTNLSLALTNIEVRMPESAEAVTRIREIAFEDVEASLADRRGRVGRFRGHGGAAVVRREKDGRLNLLGLLAVSRTNAPALPPTDSATNRATVALGGWTLVLDEMRLEDYTLKVEDLVPPKPASFLLDQLSLSLRGFSTDASRAVKADAAFRVNQTGAIALRATAVRAPLAVEAELAVTNLDVRAAQPYVEQFAALGLSSGALSAAARVRFQTNDPAAPRFAFAGGVRLTNFTTTDQALFKEFVRWDDLSVGGIQATLAPNRLAIDEVRLAQPKASLRIGADRRPNLSLILRKDAAAATNAASARQGPATNAPAEPFPVRLGRLELDRAAFVFTDESVQPQVRLGLEELSGVISNLTSALNTTADVALCGWTDPQAPFAIRGRVNPFAASRLVDLAITNANTQLTPLTGYLEKYGGYPLRKGRLSANLSYKIEGAALQAENKVQVDQLTLGPHNNSPEATKLPLKLGVALLKDNNGRIDLDVPVKGRLDDPQFSLGPIVLKILVNMIVKTAASPFKLLGALAGGGGEELSFVEFQPGVTNLVEGEADKLSKLASALAKRPSLNLEIEGEVAPALDGAALAGLKLEEQLRAARLQELTASGRLPESVAAFTLEPQERDRLLRARFVERFGTNISEIVRTNAARLGPTNATPARPAVAPKPRQNLLQRIAGLFTSEPGSPARAEKRLPKEDRQALAMATPDFMKDLLAGEIQVSRDELRQLMNARARGIQDWFAQQGQIAADRLLLVAPKTPDANTAGASRVVLSLN